MVSVEIDVSKGKSTVCILKPYGEIVCSPFEVMHVEKELESLAELLQRLDGEIRIVMEATGIYHLPVLTFFQEKGYFIAVVNPYAMKKYESNEEIYAELKLLGRRYRHYMEQHVRALQELIHVLDYTMPGIKKLLKSWNEANNKDKLSDFVDVFWHFDTITSMSREDFLSAYMEWARERKYHQSQSKATEIYELASNGIPTLSSSTPLTKMLVREAVSVLRTIDSSLSHILARMQELAKTVWIVNSKLNNFFKVIHSILDWC
nr:IS110 family transposase [Mediterraneibacter agrestimuris]